MLDVDVPELQTPELLNLVGGTLVHVKLDEDYDLATEL